MDVETGAMASLLPKLAELLDEEHKLQGSVRKDVKNLSEEMETMQIVLSHVGRVPRYQLDEQTKLWAEAARKLSYDFEEVVDQLLGTPNSQGFKGLMENMGNLLKKGKTRHQIIAAAVKDMKLQVEAVFEQHYGHNKVADTSSSYAAMTSNNPALVAPYTRAESDLVGIHGKKDQELIKLLLDGDNASNKKLKVVSVVGSGGLGKTTLVKAVYKKIQRDFDCKAFVPVGQDADAENVFTNMIAQLTMNNSYGTTCRLDVQQLIDKLREILENKRYLIVIDDIWDRRTLWKHIKYAFYENNLGSRIITTTRITSVSRECCCSDGDSVYQLEPLSDDDSKKLLYERIFPPERGCPHEFEQVSRDILKKCGGVPLAIIAMASVLAGDLWMKPKDELHLLLKSIGRGLRNECWENMERILSLSYYILPSHLKTCLLYLSTFPVTRPIERERLVKKLIVEGIIIVEEIDSGRDYYRIEHLSIWYLDELVDRNVIHPLECNNDGEVISYRIHPMMHDILKAIAMEKKFAASLDDKNISRACRMKVPHLSIDCPDSENLIGLSSMAFDCGVRSLTVFGHANQFLLRNFKGTRVLDLEGCKSIERADLEYICSMVLLKQLCLAKTDITELPPQLGNLQYWEGLDVGGTQITQLPPEIGKLQHLKTLDARKSGVKDLPDEVVQLTRLVHLLVGDNESCEGVKLPDGIGKMTSLEQLGTIDLRKYSASSLKELVELPYLKEIAVLLSNEPEDTRMNDALLSSLSSTRLRSLVVCNDFRLSTLQSSSTYNLILKKLTVVRRSLKVPIGITAHHFLRKLDIKVCRLEEDDLNILREMPRLQSLIVRLEVLPTKMIRISCEGFAKLESFCVDCRMPRVIFEEGAMPKLEHLELKIYGGSTSEEHMGIMHLLNLQMVTLRYSKWHATNKGVRETTDAMKTLAREQKNKFTLFIAEEDKDASSSRITETEEEEGFKIYDVVDVLVGIDGKQDQELTKLLSDGDNVPTKKLKIVSVVGFAGLGKTTLVKTVYDRTKSDFDCKAFVPAGQNANMNKVFMDIITDLGMYGTQLRMMDQKQLIDKLWAILENKSGQWRTILQYSRRLGRLEARQGGNMSKKRNEEGY